MAASMDHRSIMDLYVKAQRQVTSEVVCTLRARERSLKRRYERVKKPETKAQARKDLDRCSALLVDAEEQLKHLENMIQWGRDDAAEENLYADEHESVDVELDSWARHYEDMGEAETWLFLKEEYEPVSPKANVREWAARQLARSAAKLRRRAEVLEHKLANANLDLEKLTKENKSLNRRLKDERVKTKRLKERARAADASQAASYEVTIEDLEVQIKSLERQLERAKNPPLLRGSYEIVKKESERLTKVVQQLTRENKRLLDHIENLANARPV
jgi:hypothetical protein